MELSPIQEELSALSPEDFQWENAKDMPSAVIPAHKNFEIINKLFHDKNFRFLNDLTAVHFPERSGEELCIVYHLHNLRDNIRIRLKAFIPIDNPDIDSIVPLFSGANWMERETYDFFGVIFVGHPDLRRILNADEMDYHPMRKEYPMEDPTRTDKDDAMFGRGSQY